MPQIVHWLWPLFVAAALVTFALAVERRKTPGKERGWRWRLPWSDPNDTKLHMVLFWCCFAAVGFIFLNRDAVSPELLAGGAAVFGALAGGNLALWLRD